MKKIIGKEQFKSKLIMKGSLVWIVIALLCIIPIININGYGYINAYAETFHDEEGFVYVDEIYNDDSYNMGEQTEIEVDEVIVPYDFGKTEEIGIEENINEIESYAEQTTDNSDVQEISINGVKWCYIIKSDCTVKIVEGSDLRDITDIVIPEEINGMSVTEIGEYAFSSCDGLKKVVIPGNVIKINKRAFYFCQMLDNLTILSGVESIEEAAFEGCFSLKNLHIPESIISIADNTFSNLSLEHISVDLENKKYEDMDADALIDKETKTLILGCKNTIIPNGVINIKTGALSCYLTNVTIPESVINIENGAFGNGAFGSGYSLENISVEKGNKRYEDRGVNVIIDKETGILILGCNRSEIPKGVTGIGDYAFCDCNELTDIMIPEGVTSIGDCAFEWCSSLTSITLPEGVTSIGWRAFMNCSALTQVTIPRSLISIGGNGFWGCSNLRNIYYAGTEEQWNRIDIPQLGMGIESANIHFQEVKPNTPDKSDASDKDTALGSEAQGEVIPTPQPQGTTITPAGKKDSYTVTDGSDAAVSYKKPDAKATSVTIPATITDSADVKYKVTAIANNAFKNNKKIKKITVGSNIESIGKNAFSGCKNLKTITIKSTKIKKINKNAFKGLSENTVIKVPKSKKKAYIKMLKKAGFKGKIK